MSFKVKTKGHPENKGQHGGKIWQRKQDIVLDARNSCIVQIIVGYKKNATVSKIYQRRKPKMVHLMKI